MYIFEQCEGVVFRCCRGSPRDLWWLLDTSAAICFTVTLIFAFTFTFQSIFSHFESTAQWRTTPGRREQSLVIVAGPNRGRFSYAKECFSAITIESTRGGMLGLVADRTTNTVILAAQA